MIATLRKSVFLVVMVIALLAGLFGWTMKMEAAPPAQPHYGSVQANTLSIHPKFYCPPAPYLC
jgi:hypothetical protein